MNGERFDYIEHPYLINIGALRSMDEKERWITIRWGAVLAYLSAVFLLVLLIFIFPSLEMVFGIAMMFVSVVGIVPLIVVINIPFIRMRMSEKKQANIVRKGGSFPTGTKLRYEDSVKMSILIFTIVPLNLFIIILCLTMMDLVMMLLMLPVVILLSLSLLFFWKLDVRADDFSLSFHFGPFGRRIDISDIRSIHAIKVHPIRDFMGWGWRSGSDGSIGYISNSKEGVKIVTKGGRTYTVTCHRPEELVRVVRKGIRR